MIKKKKRSRKLPVTTMVKRKSKKSSQNDDSIGTNTSIFNELPDIVYKITPSGIFTFVNKSVKILGYKPEDLIGKHFNKIVHPDDVKLFSRLYVLPKYRGKKTGNKKTPKLFDERRTGSRNTRNLEIRLLTKRIKGRSKKGQIIGEVIAFADVSSTGQYNGSVRSKNKAFLGTLGIMRDTTAQKEIEGALKQSEARYRDLVEHADIAILINDMNGNFSYCNKKFADIFGYSLGNIKGRSIETLVHPEDRNMVMDFHRKRVKGSKVPSNYEFRGVKKNGSIIHLEVRAVLIKDGNRVIGTRAYLWDITERKQMEDNLHYQADLLANASDAIISTDTDFRILTWNRAAEEIYGWEAHQVIGKLIHKVTKLAYPNDDQEKVVKDFFKEGHWRGEVVQKHKKGRKLDILASVTLLKDNSGVPFGAVSVNRDITKNKKAEQALKESEQKLKNIIEHSNELFYIHDRNHRLSYVSPACEKIMGYKPKEMMVKWTTLLTDNPINKHGLESTEKAIKTGRNQKPYILEVRRKDGQKMMQVR